MFEDTDRSSQKTGQVPLPNYPVFVIVLSYIDNADGAYITHTLVCYYK